MIANTQSRKTSPGDVKEQATRFLNDALNVNRVQMETSTDHYTREVREGRLHSSTDIHPHIREEGYLAQALQISTNRPNQQVRSYIREQIDTLRDTRGPTFTAVGDMRTYGRHSAADDRVRNNSLEMDGLLPEGMSEEEQMEFAMMESKATTGREKTEGLSEEELIQVAIEENERANAKENRTVLQLYQPPQQVQSVSAVAPSITPPFASASAITAAKTSTPDVLVRTRALSVKRRASTDKSDKKTRKYLAKITNGLSNPKDDGMVNTTMAFENDPTPKRLDELIDYLDDLDEGN